MTTLIATDLDRTMIYSRRAMDELGSGQDPVCVEIYQDEPTSFMTTAAVDAYESLARQEILVPVTTRIPEQYHRVRLPGPVPRYAVTSNGGVLLVDGAVDADWRRAVRTAVAQSAGHDEVWGLVQQVCDPSFVTKLRSADGLFCYAVLDLDNVPVGFEGDMAAWAAERGWRTSLQGRKLYWVPERLTKSAALTEIAARTGATLTLAAGDSLLDLDMLLWADRAIHPRHGELFDQGWAAAGVRRTTSTGAAAGEEILTWFAAQIEPGVPMVV